MRQNKKAVWDILSCKPTVWLCGSAWVFLKWQTPICLKASAVQVFICSKQHWVAGAAEYQHNSWVHSLGPLNMLTHKHVSRDKPWNETLQITVFFTNCPKPHWYIFSKFYCCTVCRIPRFFDKYLAVWLAVRDNENLYKESFSTRKSKAFAAVQVLCLSYYLEWLMLGCCLQYNNNNNNNANLIITISNWLNRPCIL